MHSSYGQIPVYFNQHIVKRPNMRQTLPVVGVSWFRLPVLIPFSRNSHPIQGDEHSLFHFCVILYDFGFFGGRGGLVNIAIWWQHVLSFTSSTGWKMKTWRNGEKRHWDLLQTLEQQGVRCKLRKNADKSHNRSTTNIYCDKDVCMSQYPQVSSV